MTTYAIDCETEGEARLAQMIAFKKGYIWGRGVGRTTVIPLKKRKLLLYKTGHILHGAIGQGYGGGPIKTLNLSELNKLEKR